MTVGELRVLLARLTDVADGVRVVLTDGCPECDILSAHVELIDGAPVLVLDGTG